MTPQQQVQAAEDAKRYPLEMVHPRHQMATLSGPIRDTSGRIIGQQPPGQAERFPPVWAKHRDHEEYYASVGYAPRGVADVETYRRQLFGYTGTEPDTEYPRALHKRDDKGQMISCSVNNADEKKKQLAAGWFESLAEAREGRARPAPQPKAEVATDPAPKPKRSSRRSK